MKINSNVIIVLIASILLFIIFFSNSLSTTRTANWLYDTVSESSDKNIIIVTHHVPLYDLLPTEFKRTGMLMDNAPDMSQLSSVKLWIYGHLHLTPLNGYYVDLPGGFNGKRFYNVVCKPLVDIKNGITFANTASIKWSSYGTTPPTSFVLYTEQDSSVATIKYRNHQSHQWLDSYQVSFPYPFDTTTAIWFYSDTHMGTCLHVGGCNNFTVAINDMNANVPIDYSYGVGDLTHNDASWGPTFQQTIQGINAQNYYIFGNHDYGDWSPFEKSYYFDIGNLRILGMNTESTLPMSYVGDDIP